uniref:Si:dkeyp-122a9.2 n=1 Tax=Sinocyclocheilus rhinocerous TaxID=307959 RepID=A0A673KMQ9_9TELE
FIRFYIVLCLFLNNSEKPDGKTASFGALHFCFALIGLEKLMDQEFSCPCNPGFNMELISFIFLGPALLALTMMMFIQRPCRRSSFHCAGLFLFSLIPPSLWMFLLLFEGEYVARGMAHWEGDYVLDEELQIKWCKPTGVRDGKVNETELRELVRFACIFWKCIKCRTFIQNDVHSLLVRLHFGLKCF